MSRKLLAFTFCVTLACAASWCGSAHAQPDPTGVNPTHYWTYKLIDPVFKPDQLQAKDQFFTSFTPIYTDSLDRLVNWVQKNGSPVPDTLIHYTWWNIRNKLPHYDAVILRNQFGGSPANIYDLDFMLVPAWKNQPQANPPYANHYLCYRAVGQPPPPQLYQLQDEWRYDLQHVGPLEYLCVPCWKEHHGLLFPPVDTLTHLALYRIAPQSDLFYPLISDQFFTGPRPVRQTPIEYLLVPTLKQLIVTKTRVDTWGKLKLLYR